MLPNFLIVGTAKAGTTSLALALNEHPEIFVARQKECHYLARAALPQAFTGPGDLRALVRDGRAYEALFTGVAEATRIGEASVFYLYYHEVAVPTIREELGDPAIIMILRDPVARAQSAYRHLCLNGRETLPWPEALAREASRRALGYEPLWYYRELGYYSRQVASFLATFSRVHIAWYDDLVRDPAAFVREVYRFLGVDPTFRPAGLGIRHNRTGVPRHRGLYDFVVRPHPLKDAVRPLLDAVLPEATVRTLHRRAIDWSLGPGEASKGRQAALLANAFADDLARLNRIRAVPPAWRGDGG